MWSLQQPALFGALAPARQILIAGAGGGFDVYAGLPLGLALAASSKKVHLANLTFSSLDELDLDDWVAPGLRPSRLARRARTVTFRNGLWPGGSLVVTGH